MPKEQLDQNYIDFMERSEEEVYLALMDKLGVNLIPGFEHDPADTGWAEE